MTAFTEKNFCSRLFNGIAILDGKGQFCDFEPPLRARLRRATYDNHLRLIEKRVVDFLLVLSKLFP